ncbi:hypothetical protein SO694_00221018 [Aureococcus anophagefferens]|uniref:Non-specific serine/threonine protein kinase n=1 Tax=Aureococcus anophagefferens TaxID=44056 RepID=A0ABR1G5V5_AURAN
MLQDDGKVAFLDFGLTVASTATSGVVRDGIRACLAEDYATLAFVFQKVDPDFNIYEMSLPWALRRSLAPTSSPCGRRDAPGSLLGDDNRVKWDAISTSQDDGAGWSSEAGPTSSRRRTSARR